MRDFEIINYNSDIKEVFGSFDILNDIDVIDHPSVYEFARIVFNYIKMSTLLNIKK